MTHSLCHVSLAIPSLRPCFASSTRSGPVVTCRHVCVCRLRCAVVDLAPMTGGHRGFIHQLVKLYGLTSLSYDREPNRFVRVYKFPLDSGGGAGGVGAGTGSGVGGTSSSPVLGTRPLLARFEGDARGGTSATAAAASAGECMPSAA